MTASIELPAVVEYGPGKTETSLGRRIKHTAAVVLALAGVWAAKAWGNIPIDLWLHKPTAQEQFIADKAREAYGIDARVRCLDQGEMNDRTPHNQGPPPRAHTPYILNHKYLPLVWLRQSDCDGISAFTTNPNQEAHTSPQQLMGVYTLAHELEHQLGEGREYVVECKTMQRVGVLMQQFGTDPMRAEELRVRVVQMRQTQPKEPAYMLRNCHRGGPYDLGITPGGYFPQ